MTGDVARAAPAAGDGAGAVPAAEDGVRAALALAAEAGAGACSACGRKIRTMLECPLGRAPMGRTSVGAMFAHVGDERNNTQEKKRMNQYLHNQ